MILLAGSLILHVGDHALVDPDEGRNASIALEMVSSHDYLIPRLNNLPYLDKPPLYFAVVAVAIQLFGESELAARLPSVLFAMATVVLTAWFAAQLFGRRSAWVAATACATAPFAIVMARVAIFDSMLSFLVVLALIAFYRAVEANASGFRGRLWTLVAWTAMALGVLTKGPVALLIPLLVATPYAVWRRRTLAVWSLLGVATFLLIVLPWVLTVERVLPGFLRYALLIETWQRVTTDQLHRGGPIWYFLPYLLAGCFPWIVVVLFSSWRRSDVPNEGRHPLIFIALWSILPLIFFSFSNSKRPQYILPLIPAVALMAAWIWSGKHPPVRGVRIASLLWVLFGGVLVTASLVEARPEIWGGYEEVGRRPAMVFGVLAVLSGILSWTTSRHRSLALVALSLPLIALTSITAPVIAAVANSRSGSALAATLRPHLRADTVLVGVDTFIPSLNFYLHRPIRLSSSTGDPLRSNYALHAYKALAFSNSSTLRPGAWWNEALRSCSEPLIFLVSSRQQKEQMVLRAAGLPLIYQDGKMLAMGPCYQKLRRTESQVRPLTGSTMPGGGG